MTSEDDSSAEPTVPFPHSPTGTTGLQKAFAIAIRKVFKKRLGEIYHYLKRKPEILQESIILKASLDDATMDFIINMLEGIKLELSPIVVHYLGMTWDNAMRKSAGMMGRSGTLSYDDRVKKAFQDESYKFLHNFVNGRQEELKYLLSEEMSQGDTIPDIIEKIKDSFQISASKAEIIGRTEVVRTHNVATRMAIENAGVTKEYKWLTSQRENVCPICRPRHGKIYRVDDPNSPMPIKDSHPNCNCSIIPQVRINEEGDDI